MTQVENISDRGARQPTATSLRNAGLEGVLWTAVQKWGVRSVAFLVFIFLGRLLEPSDFGIVAVAAAFGAWSGLLVDFGLPLFLIQSADVSSRVRDTVLWIGMFFALAMVVLQVAIAEPVAHWIGEPQVANVLRVLALALPLASLAGIQGALFKRQLRFKALAIRSLVAVTVSGISAVILAFIGLGVWALVGQAIAFQLTSVIVLWLAAPWVPSVRLDSQVAKEALGFGGKAIASFTLDSLAGTVDVLVVGYRLGAPAAGIYTMGTRLTRVVLDSFVSILFAVANPLFAKAKGDRRILAAAYCRATTQAILLSSGALAILAATFGPTLDLVVGPKWVTAATVGTLITISEAIRVPMWFDKSLLYAVGRPGTELALTVVEAVLLLAAVFVGSEWGLVGVGVGLCVRVAVMWPIRLLVSARMCGVAPAPLMLRELRIWIAAAISGGVSWAAVTTAGSLPLLIAVAIASLAGVIAFVACLSVLARADLKYTRGILLRVIHSKWSKWKEQRQRADLSQTG